MTSFAMHVGVRVRSVPATESGANTIKIEGGNTVILAGRPGDQIPKVLDWAFPASASQSDIWNACGETAYETAVVKKEHACICVWGGRESGKSFTCLGDDNGVVNGAMRALAGNADANMTVVLIRNDQIQDLGNPKSDNLRVKYEESSGVIFEGSSTVKIPSLDTAKDHLKKCLDNRAEVFKTSGSTKDTTFTVYHFGVGEEGSFTVIECCSSDRIVLAEPNEEQKKENTIRLKNLQQFSRTLLDASVNADSKAIGWRDCKATRFLQPALSQAMEEAKGFFALIVCVDPRKHAVLETHVNVSLADGTMKQDSLKTVGEYKLMQAQFEERTEADGKESGALAAAAKTAESHMLQVKAENADKAAELSEKVAELKSLVPRTQASIDQEMDRFKKDLEREKDQVTKQLAGEEDRLKNLSKNAPAQIDSDSKKAVAKVEAEMVESSNKIKEKIKEAEAELSRHKAIAADAERLKAEAKSKEQESMRPVKESKRELDKLKKELESAGKCREDGMEEEEVQRMIPMWEARDELDQVDREVMDLARETCSLDYIHTRKFGAPSDSDSDSDSDSSDSSESPSEKADREREEREEAEREAAAEKARREEEAFEKEHAFGKDAVYREKFLHDLVDKVMCYLEYGTNVAVLTSKGFTRHFLYMTRNRKQWALVAEVAEGQVPIKKDPIRVIPIEQVGVMHLGQHSPNFTNFLKKVAGRADPPRHEQPPPPEELSPANMHRFYYRGFSLQMKRDSEEWLDIVCDTQTDFEALVVAYNRLTGREAEWGRKMFIDLADRVDELKPYERKLCEDLHLTPVQYFSAKEKVLADPEVLFMTLHDMRLLTTLDLYHCQRLMDVFLQQKWVAVRDLVYFKYWEDHERYEAEQAAAWGEGGEGGEGDYGGEGDDMAM